MSESADDDYKTLLRLEQSLEDILDKKMHEVDGHDFGSGIGNIFIDTNDPFKTIKIALTIIKPAEYPSLRVAFRESNDYEYQIIWPENSKEKFKLI